MPGPSEAEINAHWWQAAARALAEAPPEAREQLRRLFAADFQEPENYNPAMIDYHRRSAERADSDQLWNVALGAGLHMPAALLNFATSGYPAASRMSNVASKVFGWGNLGLAAQRGLSSIGDGRRAAAHRGHQADYEAGGRAFTPEELAEMFRPRPPMSR